MTWDERAMILQNMQGVMQVIPVDDKDGTVCNGIYYIKTHFGNRNLVFCNGGDRGDRNTPEMALCQGLGIELAWNVGGGKTSSSSHLLSTWSNEPVERSWGQWRVFQNYTGAKVKELTIRPHQSTSLQKHEHRQELLNAISGKGLVACATEHYTYDEFGQKTSTRLMMTNAILDSDARYGGDLCIRAGQWHQIQNPFDTDLVIVEIQRGLQCLEEDIVRADPNDPDGIPPDLLEIIQNTRDIYQEWNSN